MNAFEHIHSMYPKSQLLFCRRKRSSSTKHPFPVLQYIESHHPPTNFPLVNPQLSSITLNQLFAPLAHPHIQPNEPCNSYPLTTPMHHPFPNPIYPPPTSIHTPPNLPLIYIYTFPYPLPAPQPYFSTSHQSAPSPPHLATRSIEHAKSDARSRSTYTISAILRGYQRDFRHSGTYLPRMRQKTEGRMYGLMGWSILDGRYLASTARMVVGEEVGRREMLAREGGGRLLSG